MVLTTEKAGGLIPPAFSKKDKNMKYLITKDTMANGEKVFAGDVVELSVEEGTVLVNYGKAEISTGKATETKDRSVGLKKSDKPKLTRRKSKDVT